MVQSMRTSAALRDGFRAAGRVLGGAHTELTPSAAVLRQNRARLPWLWRNQPSTPRVSRGLLIYIGHSYHEHLADDPQFRPGDSDHLPAGPDDCSPLLAGRACPDVSGYR